MTIIAQLMHIDREKEAYHFGPKLNTSYDRIFIKAIKKRESSQDNHIDERKRKFQWLPEALVI